MPKAKKQVEKAVKPAKFLLESHSKLSLHYLTGHSLEWYLRMVLQPIIYLTIANIIVTALGGHPATRLLVNSSFLPMLFVAELVVYGWLGTTVTMRALGKTLPRGMTWASAAVTGGLAGFGLGLVVAIFKVFWFHQAWTFFNVITEAPLRFIEGFIVAGLISLITITVMRIRRQSTLSSHIK